MLSPVAFHLPLEAHVLDADAAARVRAFMQAPQRVTDYAWGRRLIETGEAFLAPRMDLTAVTAEVAEVYRTIGVHSLLVTVLRVRGESSNARLLQSALRELAEREKAEAALRRT